jgi:hypothetical protein
VECVGSVKKLRRLGWQRGIGVGPKRQEMFLTQMGRVARLVMDCLETSALEPEVLVRLWAS